jgi:hypothetical protein
MCGQFVGIVPAFPHVQKQALYIALSHVIAKWSIEYSSEL